MFACGDWQLASLRANEPTPSSRTASGGHARAEPSVQEQFGAHQFLRRGQVRPLNAVYTLPGLTEAPAVPTSH